MSGSMELSPARKVGLVGLALGPFAVFSLVVAPAALIVSGDAGATAERLRSSDLLLRLTVGAELASATLFLLYALALYRLFRPVHERNATLMVVFVLASVPISFLSVAPEIAASNVAGHAPFLSGFAPAQVDALAYLLLRIHATGVYLAQIFWGLWLFPMALLAIKSGFVPRIVAALLLVAGTAYILHSAAVLLVPPLASAATLAVIGEAGELSLIVWLLGARYGSTSAARKIRGDGLIDSRG